MINTKKYREYFLERCPICKKEITGVSERQTRHNFAIHLESKHDIPYTKAIKYKIEKNKIKILSCFILSVGCLMTIGTNWMIPPLLVWGFSSLSFRQSLNLTLDKLKEKTQRWKMKHRWNLRKK